MPHRKRLSAPEQYPIERKDNTYVIAGRGPHTEEQGIPLAVLLRDVLGYADTVSETKEILQERNVQVNGRVQTDPQFTVGFMDVISIDRIDKDFRVLVNEQGLVFIEIDDSEQTLYRVQDKTTLQGGQTQLNLDGGENIITDEDIDTQGSLLIDLEDRDIQQELPLAEGSIVYITGGQHVGEIATIQDVNIVRGSQSNRVNLANDDSEFETIVDYVYVIGEDESEVAIE